MTKQRCDGCRSFFRSGSQLIGECRRYPPQHAHTQHGWLMVEQSDFCGEWQDARFTPEQAERRELVRQFALSIVEGWYASANRLPEDRFVWPEQEPWRVWEQAEIIVEWEGRKEGDGPEGQT